MFVKTCLWLASAAATLATPSRVPTYDYVVVGGGTAGIAVAARLSKDLPKATILIIEAGPAVFDELKINVPGMKGATMAGKYDWNFTTVAQSGAYDRVFAVNRGKVLGGSSALNFMSYDRAAAAEYDSWEALGNPGWNWETMIAAMMKSETFTGKNTATYGSSGVGDSGPIQAVVNRIVPEYQDSWIPTLNKLGVPKNLESLGGDPLGVMYQPGSVDPASYNRSYSANSYLDIAGSNLRVLTSTTVAKINLAKSGSKQAATGVTLKNGTYIKASREVILSAGSIQSPGLLEKSGIGKKSVLSAAGITQIVNLPGVGENLQDHLRVMNSYQLKSNYTSFDVLRFNATVAAEQLALWKAGEPSLYDYTASGFTFTTWKDVLGNDSSLVALAKEAAGEDASVVDQKKLEFLNDSSVPQLEVIFSDGYTGVKGYPATTSSLYGQSFFSLLAIVMHPLSRGTVHINPSDVDGKPLIDPNYFGNDHDLEAISQAVKYSRKIATTEPLRSLWDSEYEPGSDVDTDAEREDYVKNTALTIYHPIGTCSMLPKADGGVVDPKLRVYGTTKLRIVDASIMPLLISAHIQTAVYGIAEVAAALIAKDYST